MNISSRQLFWLIWTFDVGMSLLLTTAPTIQIAKQDAWISVSIAAMGGLAITWVALSINLSLPNKTLVEIAESLLGKWLGKLLILLYLVMWISVTGIILREFADFVHVALFDKTPLWVILVTFLGLMVYVVIHSGLEGIARISEMLGPIVVITIIVAILMSLGQLKFRLMLPIYEDTGWQKILQGSVPSLSFFCESIVVMMLVPFVRERERVKSRTLKAVFLASFFVAISALLNVFMWGPNLPGSMVYPSYEFTRFISMLEFIQNIDVIFVIVWMFSFFIKLTIYMFVSSYGVSQWIGIKQWKSVVWSISVVVFAIALFPSFIWIKTIYLKNFWIPYVLPINMVGIPILLWVINLVKQKASKMNSTGR